MNPSAFDIGRQIGTNVHESFNRVKDENAIESILSQAMSTGDPEVYQNSIGKILSQVSPERQGAAIKYLEQAHNNVLARQDQQRKLSQQQQEQQKAFQEQQYRRQQEELAGVTPGIDPRIQAQQIKDRAKQERLSQYNLSSGSSDQKKLANNQEQNLENTQQIEQIPTESIFKKLSDDQLVVASGAPDKEVSDPAKSELKRRDEERKIDQKERESSRKSHTEISQEILKANEKESSNLIEAESALDLMENSIANKDMSFFTPDNLAEITGIEGLRSKEGALFKTSGKEFFLGTLNRSGARPNQFIEQQIVDMLPKIGRSAAANLSVARAFRNEIDLKKEKVRLTRELADELEKKLGYVPRNIGQLRDEKLKEYAENKQKEFNNDLRAIKSIDEKKNEKFLNVKDGTPISKVVAESLLRKYNYDVQKASDEAKKLGYAF